MRPNPQDTTLRARRLEAQCVFGNSTKPPREGTQPTAIGQDRCILQARCPHRANFQTRSHRFRHAPRSPLSSLRLDRGWITIQKSLSSSRRTSRGRFSPHKSINPSGRLKSALRFLRAAGAGGSRSDPSGEGLRRLREPRSALLSTLTFVRVFGYYEGCKIRLNIFSEKLSNPRKTGQMLPFIDDLTRVIRWECWRMI
jgi:hypothetical protein